MNREDVEARLERSLRRQIAAPKTDGRFDAAVWSRIAAEEQQALAPPRARARMPRWLSACNVLGIAVTVVLVVVYGMRALGGMDLGLALDFPRPGFSAEQWSSLIRNLGPAVSTVAVVFGFLFTRHGRRLISSLR